MQAYEQYCKELGDMEEKLAKKWYGTSYDKLSYDDKDYVTCEAMDRVNHENN